MVKARGYPGAAGMAVFAGIIALHMCCMLAGSRGAIMAG